MNFEESVIELLEKPYSGRENQYSRDLKYLAIDLIAESFDLNQIIENAKKSGVSQRLGHLCEVTAEAAKNKGFQNASQLYLIAQKLYRNFNQWQYLNPHAPNFAKRIISSSPQKELNKKWRVYGTLNSKDIEEWIMLYLSEHVTAP